MFIVLLEFGPNKALAGQHMAGHNAWLARGFEEGVFAFAGSIQPAAGGAIIAHHTTADALRARVEADPFVAEGVVVAEILAVKPSRVDERLAFLA